MVTSACKLRPYFQDHPIRVLTNYQLHQVLQNLELSSRIAKWDIELGEFDIEYVPRTVIKVHALADFVAELTEHPESTIRAVGQTTNVLVVEGPNTPDHDFPRWNLFVDGSSSSSGFGEGLVLMSPDHYKTNYALLFNFKVSNNRV